MKPIDNMICVEKLRHDGASYRLNGIVECLDNRSVTDVEIEELQRLKNDHVVIGGREISAYVTALLDVLGVEIYRGNDDIISSLIRAWKSG